MKRTSCLPSGYHSSTTIYWVRMSGLQATSAHKTRYIITIHVSPLSVYEGYDGVLNFASVSRWKDYSCAIQVK
uniref:Uncharacterized protein n=1 Tax=Arundo donax TaxID=35708 RepID=A0A0A9AHX0_ARUDO